MQAMNSNHGTAATSSSSSTSSWLNCRLRFSYLEDTAGVRNHAHTAFRAMRNFLEP
jgi:hypothetical protein